MEWTGAPLVAVFLATLNERLVEYFIEPIFDKLAEKVDKKFWMPYAAAACGIAIGIFSEVNLFEMVDPQFVGIGWRILTAILIGGGSNLIHMLFSAADRANR